jgi:cytochrome c biogenesis protein CcdA
VKQVVQVIVFIITIFIGWLIFDFVKHKKLTKENTLTALIAAVVAGVAYYVLFGLF